MNHPADASFAQVEVSVDATSRRVALDAGLEFYFCLTAQAAVFEHLASVAAPLLAFHVFELQWMLVEHIKSDGGALQYHISPVDFNRFLIGLSEFRCWWE